MQDTRISEQNPRAISIICLEGSTRLWKLLKRSLDGLEGSSSEFIFARSRDAATDVLVLCRRLAPALIVIEDSRTQVLPFKQLRDMISRRDIQVLVFSDKAQQSSYEEFFRMGCAGVVPYKVTPQILKKAVFAIRQGELWLPRKVLSKLAQDSFLKAATRKITPRESEIFNLICLGFTNQQIAEHLFISRETVRWHLRSLYSKIGVDSRTGAIRYAKYGREGTDAPQDPVSANPA
jgi:DNA-binding NarL/FixJ family response regulator